MLIRLNKVYYFLKFNIIYAFLLYINKRKIKVAYYFLYVIEYFLIL